jgi:hypothetical protein
LWLESPTNFQRASGFLGSPSDRFPMFGQKNVVMQRKQTSALRVIVLQKSKVAGLRIFRKNTKRKAIADSYNLYRVTEVAYEFNVRR